MSADADAPAATGLVDALRAALPADVAVAGGRIGAATLSPYEEENAAVARAVERRRREFVAGRAYARAALARLGVPAAAIAVAPSRAPRWPAAAVGSISHAGEQCVAVVAAGATYLGVGVDIELAGELPPELHASVLAPGEADAATGDGLDDAKTRFVAKEAFYKLYHPLVGRFLDFTDASVRVDAARGTFVLQLRDDVPALAGWRTFAGVCGQAGGHRFAFVALRNAAPALAMAAPR